ncbi:DegV family protein [Thermoflavimicrobium daqui]|uniref:Fatty acid-binding protein DegV n=1 Tax=Thermoflavimicrobium daqui TaxID=2137476 RepID=A0A364K986_9BACL|nr:DegV family protein [Thermoflavimicrobium daqui]RAL26866.1 fatty acid-binding protein DegV [Thermoflavimicrobium daqui]
MNRIAIITDSSCDLPASLLEKWNIKVVPIRVIYSHGDYRDGIDITPEEVCDKLHEEIPKTSMPAPKDIIQTLKLVQDEGYTHCIILTVSAALSGTYNAFKLIVQDFDMKIEVIDSKGLSWLLGFLAIEVAKMVQDKMNFQEIIEKIEQTRQKLMGFFIVDTLEYLKAGGRIGKVAATLGSLLNLKPIISVDEEGKFYPFTVGRGRKQAIKKMLEPVLKQVESTKTSLTIIHTKAEQEAMMLKERFKKMENIVEIYISHISSSLVVHTGPGLLGLVINTASSEN